MSTSGRDEILRHIEVLNSSQDRDRLAHAAIELAASEDPAAIAALREHLHRKEFLERLDDLGNPQTSTYHLHRMFGALERNPSAATAELCVALANDPEFTSEMDRLNDLLPALAAVRPVTDRAAEVFRRTNGEGFYHVNAPLLVRNGSPIALTMFEEMIEDRTVDQEDRIFALHVSVLPHRTELRVLEACDRLLRKGLEPAVEIGVIETIFDYRQKQWFGPVRTPPMPPPWQSASSEALHFVIDLAARVRTRSDLPPGLQQAIAETVAAVTEILAGRAA